MPNKKPDISNLDRDREKFFRKGELSKIDREKVEKWTEYFKEKVVEGGSP